MENSFSQLTLTNFLDELASDNPTPGGGSAAALGASQAAALVLMVIRVTKKDTCELNSFSRELARIIDEATELMDEDAAAFQQVMAAFRLPKNTDDEKAKRSRRIQNSLREASITPFKTMKLGIRILEIARNVVEVGNPNAISDVGVAALMALSAVKGGYYNVRINTQSLKDKSCCKVLEEDGKEILKRAGKLAREIEDIVREKVEG